MRCYFQAESFLNAAHVIGANDQAMLKANASGQDMSTFRQTMGVNVVCLAFSLELFLKDLHFVLNGKAPGKHEIRDLFEALPEEIQLEIVELHPWKWGSATFGSQASSPLDKFKTNLDEINKGFVKWRYSHEYSTLHYDVGFVIELINVIKKVVNRIDTKNTHSRTA